ncbi:MAG TPA: Rieske (2Fe-2S) protein [Vicinamibacterales bacterium]|nr:Rieske (2Fe-2S) protein [Vicinamibacterales bacterium]
MQSSTDDRGRRRFFVATLTTIHAAIAGFIGVIIGGAVASPVFGREREQETWIPAGDLNSLPDNEPIPVLYRVAREDGYREIMDRRVLYLLKNGDEVTAMDTTCTHLGCPVRWDADAKAMKCPCHGGVYDKTGTVVSGPPPKPLARFTTRIDGGQILVRV